MMSCGPKTAQRNLELARAKTVDMILYQIIEKFRQLTPAEQIRVLQTIKVHLQITGGDK